MIVSRILVSVQSKHRHRHHEALQPKKKNKMTPRETSILSSSQSTLFLRQPAKHRHRRRSRKTDPDEEDQCLVSTIVDFETSGNARPSYVVHQRAADFGELARYGCRHDAPNPISEE
jgi:hypothetical protein